MSKQDTIRFILFTLVGFLLLWWALHAIVSREDFIEGAIVLCLFELHTMNERQRWLNATFKKFFRNKFFT